MAAHTRASRRRSNKSTLHTLGCVEAASDAVRTPSDRDSSNGNLGSKRIKQVADRHQTADAQMPQVVVSVQGKEMPVRQTYDPDTYDPDARMPWTPEPDPYSPDAYAAWGQKHFGQEWFQLRQTMLEERNVFLQYDAVYHERQRAPRIIEHEMERRPFEPQSGIHNRGWKRLWARLSKELGIEIPPSPTPEKDDDGSDTDLSGYDTYAPTPEYRELTPLPDDPWEKLGYDRRRFSWNEERYQYEKIFLREALIDGARSRYENEPGNRKSREKRELMEGFRYVDPDRFRLERKRFQHNIDLPNEGWTTEQIEAMYNAMVSMDKWRKKNPTPIGSSEYLQAVTPDKLAARESWTEKHNAAWIEFYGELPLKGTGLHGLAANPEEEKAKELWRQNIHARLCSRQLRGAQPGAKGDASVTEEPPKPPGLSPRQTAEVLHGTRGGRVTRKAPTRAKALPLGPRRRPLKPDIVGRLGDGTKTAPQLHKRQRKTYEKEHSSRRQAGKAPEYGMLEEFEMSSSLRKLSNTRPKSRSSPRSGNQSRGARSVKPRETLKSRQTGRGGRKRSAKGSKC